MVVVHRDFKGAGWVWSQRQRQGDLSLRAITEDAGAEGMGEGCT